MSTLAETALAYAERGWPVFPLRPGEKVPLIAKAEGGNGVHDATTDVAQIRAWWEIEPEANIGLACGTAHLVLDVDYTDFFAEKPDGATSLTALQQRFGKLPDTVRQYTGGMGWQFFFQPDERIRNGVKILPGLDTRSAGGYVVAPPSLHPSGRHYRWLAGPDEAELSPAPAWLIALLEPVIEPERAAPTPVRAGNLDRYVRAALDRACESIAGAGIGTQCDALEHQAYGIGRLVGGGMLGTGEAKAELVAAGLKMRSGSGRSKDGKGYKPWTYREIEWRVDRALENGKRSPRRPEERA